MTISNRGLIATVVTFIVIYLLAIINDVVNSNQLIFILILNFSLSLVVLLYWIIKQLRIKIHYFELRELVVLSLEVVILVSSCFAIFQDVLPKWFQMIEYVFFGIQFIALILFLIFALTFRMKKLF